MGGAGLEADVLMVDLTGFDRIFGVGGDGCYFLLWRWIVDWASAISKVHPSSKLHPIARPLAGLVDDTRCYHRFVSFF